MSAEEEQRQRAGTGMGADHRAGVADKDVFHAALFPDQLFQVPGVVDAVAVADEHGFVLAGQAQLQRLLDQRLDGGLPAPDLAHVDEVAVIVGMKHGLDLQHGAHQRRGGAVPPPPLRKPLLPRQFPLPSKAFSSRRNINWYRSNSVKYSISKV